MGFWQIYYFGDGFWILGVSGKCLRVRVYLPCFVWRGGAVGSVDLSVAFEQRDGLLGFEVRFLKLLGALRIRNPSLLEGVSGSLSRAFCYSHRLAVQRKS